MTESEVEDIFQEKSISKKTRKRREKVLIGKLNRLQLGLDIQRFLFFIFFLSCWVSTYFFDGIIMVGFNPEPINGRELSSFEYSEAGLLSGIATRAIIQPLDVLKIRFQVCFIY